MLHSVQNIDSFPPSPTSFLDLVWWAYCEYWIAGAKPCENTPEK